MQRTFRKIFHPVFLLFLAIALLSPGAFGAETPEDFSTIFIGDIAEALGVPESSVFLKVVEVISDNTITITNPSFTQIVKPKDKEAQELYDSMQDLVNDPNALQPFKVTIQNSSRVLVQFRCGLAIGGSLQKPIGKGKISPSKNAVLTFQARMMGLSLPVQAIVSMRWINSKGKVERKTLYRKATTEGVTLKITSKMLGM